MTDDDRERVEGDATFDRRRVLKGAATTGVAGTGIGALSGGGSASTWPNTITIVAKDVLLEYEFEVSGKVEKGRTAGGTDEIVDDHRVVGREGKVGSTDDYRFTGDLVSFRIRRGDAKVTVNGTEISVPVEKDRDEEKRKKKDKTPLPNRITVRAEGEGVKYQFRVGGRVVTGPNADAEGDVLVDESTVRGIVGGQGVDDYFYSGGLCFDTADGPITVTLDIDDP